MAHSGFVKIIFFIIAIVCGLWLFDGADVPQSAPSVGEVEKPPPAKIFEHDKKIQTETDALLYLFDRMPPVPVYLSDEPVDKSGTNTERGVGYTACDDSRTPTIYIKKVFYQNANQKQRVNILKHELTHAYLCRQNRMSGHDEAFRRKFAEVGGFGN